MESYLDTGNYLDDCCMCGGSLNDICDGHTPVPMSIYYEEATNPEPIRRTTMNYSTAVMLINENIKAVKVTYEPDGTSSQIARRTMYKTLDNKLKVGDLVVVPTDTRHKFTIAKVDELDVEVDFESSEQVMWIAGNAPVDVYQDILSKEDEMIKVVKASEKRAKREELRKNMIGLQDDQNLETLAISNMASTTTVIEVEEESK